MHHKSSAVTEYIIKNKYLLIFYCGVTAGTFFANFFGRDNINSWGLYNRDYLEMMSAVTFDYMQLWRYVAVKRVKMFGIMLLCAATSIKTVCMLAFMMIGGFELGIMVSMASMQYGAAGIILVFVSLFPQWIFYIAAIVMLIKIMTEAADRNHARISAQKKEKAQGAAVMLILVLLGIGVEALINPMLIKNYIYAIY